MNFVNEYGEKRNGFAEVVAFCHMTCRYFDRFLLQGVDKNLRQACFFYLAPSLICEGYLQVNSRRSTFRIADPTLTSFYGTIIMISRLLLNSNVFVQLQICLCSCIAPNLHIMYKIFIKYPVFVKVNFVKIHVIRAKFIFMIIL